MTMLHSTASSFLCTVTIALLFSNVPRRASSFCRSPIPTPPSSRQVPIPWMPSSEAPSKLDAPHHHRRPGWTKPMNMATGSSNEDEPQRIRYLGSGKDAIIRPGVVMVAPNHEYDHFLMRSAVFVYAIGLDENQDVVIRGKRIRCFFEIVLPSGKFSGLSGHSTLSSWPTLTLDCIPFAFIECSS